MEKLQIVLMVDIIKLFFFRQGIVKIRSQDKQELFMMNEWWSTNVFGIQITLNVQRDSLEFWKGKSLS